MPPRRSVWPLGVAAGACASALGCQGVLNLDKDHLPSREKCAGLGAAKGGQTGGDALWRPARTGGLPNLGCCYSRGTGLHPRRLCPHPALRRWGLDALGSAGAVSRRGRVRLRGVLPGRDSARHRRHSGRLGRRGSLSPATGSW
ncbi:MAG: hypothetical protein Q8Q15_01650 [bacterium]|nr:hypothetical protein [bacterium]